jgi:hypothetical protein
MRSGEFGFNPTPMAAGVGHATPAGAVVTLSSKTIFGSLKGMCYGEISASGIALPQQYRALFNAWILGGFLPVMSDFSRADCPPCFARRVANL